MEMVCDPDSMPSLGGKFISNSTNSGMYTLALFSRKEFLKVDDLETEVSPVLSRWLQTDHKGPYRRKNFVSVKVTGGSGRRIRGRDLKVLCHSLLHKERGPETQKRQVSKVNFNFTECSMYMSVSKLRW